MDLIELIGGVLNTPFKRGVNDCNTITLKVLDHIVGTEWEKQCNYTSLAQGKKQLKELGFNSIGDIITQYADIITVPIDGDIWIDGLNAGVVISNRMTGIDDEHKIIKLVPIPTEGTFYRIRK